VPRLAPNIIVVPPESGLSTYALMSLCNAAIIYGTKMGVELTSVGLPVIVAGEAWIRNKGITHDATSPEEYFRLLAQLPSANGSRLRSSRAPVRLRVSLFFNRMIPLPFIEPKAGHPITAQAGAAAAAAAGGRRPRHDLRGHPGEAPFSSRSAGPAEARPLQGARRYLSAAN